MFKQSRSSRVPPGLEGEMRAVETKGHASMRRITFGLTSSSLIFEAARRSWRQLIAASLLGPAMAAAKRGRCSRFSSGCAKAILARELLRMAATERGRGHDHQKDSNHALMRALATGDGSKRLRILPDHPRMPIAAVGVTIVYERALASPITNRHVPWARLRTIAPCFFGPA